MTKTNLELVLDDVLPIVPLNSEDINVIEKSTDKMIDELKGPENIYAIRLLFTIKKILMAYRELEKKV